MPISIEKDQIKDVMRFFHVIWNESGGRPVCVQVWVTGGLWRPTSVPEKTHHPPNGPPTQQPRPHASLLLTTTLTAIPVYHWNFGLAISRSELQLLGNVSLFHEKQWRQQGGCKEKSGSKSRSGFTWAIDHPLIYAAIMFYIWIEDNFEARAILQYLWNWVCIIEESVLLEIFCECFLRLPYPPSSKMTELCF